MIERNLQTHGRAGAGFPDGDLVDRAFRNYFHAETPSQWPAPQVPEPVSPLSAKRFWSGSLGRLALAASILLLVAGYLSLAKTFPQANNVPTVGPSSEMIGSKIQRFKDVGRSGQPVEGVVVIPDHPGQPIRVDAWESPKKRR